MRTFQTITDLRTALSQVRAHGRSIGFVPTMGALHEGHRSLVRLSKQQADVTVVSIFVNPTQFGPAEDFALYPRTLDSDRTLLIEDEVEFLFTPSVEEMYPAGDCTTVHVGGITDEYEGAIRPGHFDGVATVVTKLFQIVQPSFAFFGQKDAQQVAVIQRIVADLMMPLSIVVGDTIREIKGLAMSSRNRLLSETALTESMAMYAALLAVRDAMAVGMTLESAAMAGREEFQRIAPSAVLDYLDVVHSETFRPVTSFEPLTGGRRASHTVIIAARFGNTRLIDNLPIEF